MLDTSNGKVYSYELSTAAKANNNIGKFDDHITLPDRKFTEHSENLEKLQLFQEQIVQSLLPVLESLGYDQVNQGVRADYLSSPLPHSSYRLIHNDLKMIADDLLKEQQRIAVNFFMLGNPISDKEFYKLAGQKADSLKEVGIESELIIHGHEGFRLNNLALISSKQANGKIIYCFADLPPYYHHEYKKQRVYSGADSYILNWRLMQIPSVSGIILEPGSGTGYQLFTMLNKHQSVSRAIGIELDARARNISLLNAALNGMHDKFSVFETLDSAYKTLGRKKIDLAFSNPPFICVPDAVEVKASELQFIPQDCKPDPATLLVDINRLFMKAGAGGKDGLAVTGLFFDSIKTRLASNAEFIVFSQFAVNSEGRPLAAKLGAQEQFSHEFERFTGAGNFGNTFNYALYLIGALETQYPSLKDSEFVLSVGAKAQMTFFEQNIKGFQSGFIRFKKSEYSNYTEREITAPEPITPLGMIKKRPAPLLGLSPDFIV